MSQIGLIRRIDELGRIVVPKEIRKTLRIQNGECFEVFLKENEIVLKKYSVMSKYPELLEYLIKTIGELYKNEFILTDMNRVIYCSSIKKNDLVDKELDNKYIDLINSGKRKISNNKMDFVENYDLDLNYVIEPFSINGDIVGSIVLLKKENITDLDTSSLDLIHKILIKYLEE